MEVFRSAYADFEPENATMMREIAVMTSRQEIQSLRGKRQNKFAVDSDRVRNGDLHGVFSR